MWSSKSSTSNRGWRKAGTCFSMLTASGKTIEEQCKWSTENHACYEVILLVLLLQARPSCGSLSAFLLKKHDEAQSPGLKGRPCSAHCSQLFLVITYSLQKWGASPGLALCGVFVYLFVFIIQLLLLESETGGWLCSVYHEPSETVAPPFWGGTLHVTTGYSSYRRELLPQTLEIRFC